MITFVITFHSLKVKTMLKPEEHFGKMYQPVEGGDCEDCVFHQDSCSGYYCNEPSARCEESRRSDGLNVHYINIEGE